MAKYSIDEVMNADSGKKTYTLSEIVDKPAETGKQINSAIASIPRQLGLTARAGIEGIGDLADFVSSPVRVGLNALGGDFRPGVGSIISDMIGLPKPETTTEKVANTGARMMVPAGGFIKAGDALQKGGEVASGVGKLLSANPAMQITSAASGGSAGQYVKETGGNDLSQFVASLAGGVAAPVAVNAVSRAPQAITNGAKRFVETIAPGVVKQADPMELNLIINNQLKDSGLTMQMLPQNVQASIRNDVSNALNVGSELNGDALRRLIDYRLIGATPRTGNLTLDPVTLTQQKNLAKLGANSKDPAAQLLAQAENQNNSKLIEGLNVLGAGKGDIYNAGGSIISSILGKDAAMKSHEQTLYDIAKQSAGRQIPLDREHFVNDAYRRLAESNKGAFLPDDIGTLLENIRVGQFKKGGNVYETPFNVDTIDNLKTTLASASRGAKDGNVKTAISNVRDALENTPVYSKPAQVGGSQLVDPAALKGAQTKADEISADALKAFDEARAFARSRRVWQESSPSIDAALSGAEPDKFVEQFIIGSGSKSSVMDAAKLKNEIADNKSAMNQTRNAIAGWLKGKALNGAADEVGNFSQSAYNKALSQIGERKLQLFFSPEELQNMKAIGRVASYEQVQPRGSAVNNSNTAGTAIATLLDRIGNSPLLSKIPLGKVIAEPAQNISVGLQSRNAVNVPSSLVMPMQKRPLMLGISPALGIGLLGSE